MVALPFTQLADELGATKVANIVMLGALLEATGMLDQNRVVGALKRLVAPRFFELDLAALARGREEFLRPRRGRLPLGRTKPFSSHPRTCNLTHAVNVSSLGASDALIGRDPFWRNQNDNDHTETGGLVARARGLSLWVTFAADERSCNMRDAALPTNQITYVLCEQGLLLVTKDDGATWAQRKIPIENSILRAVSFHDVNRGLVVGDDGSIFATEDAGATWTARKSGTTENLTDIQMIGEEGWIAGYDGVILHTADGGKTWAKQDSGSALSLEALFFHDTQNGWAVGWAGTVLHTVDGGKKWQSLKVNGASWSLSSHHLHRRAERLDRRLRRPTPRHQGWRRHLGSPQAAGPDLADLHRLRQQEARLDHHRHRLPDE